MKDRALTVLSLVLAVGALGHSIWLQQRADTLATEALRRRESELVHAAAPKFARIYQDMTGKPFDAASFHPTTLEELGVPLLSIISNMSTGTDTPQPQTPK